MKITLIILALVVVTVLPVIYMGNKYFDGPVSTSTYKKSIQYDEKKRLEKDYILDIVSNSCESDMCLLVFQIKPHLEGQTAKVSVTSPLSKNNMVQDIEVKDDIYTVKYLKEDSSVFDSKGVINYHIEYSVDNILMDQVGSLWL